MDTTCKKQKRHLLIRDELTQLRDNHRKWDSETHSSGVADQIDDIIDLLDTLWSSDEPDKETGEPVKG